jgi:hypothetical protein
VGSIPKNITFRGTKLRLGLPLYHPYSRLGQIYISSGSPLQHLPISPPNAHDMDIYRCCSGSPTTPRTTEPGDPPTGTSPLPHRARQPASAQVPKPPSHQLAKSLAHQLAGGHQLARSKPPTGKVFGISAPLSTGCPVPSASPKTPPPAGL